MQPLTTQELFFVEEFRSKVLDLLVTDEYKSEHYLIRWIRARDFNLAKAEVMIRNHFKWRKEYNVDDAKDVVFDDLFHKHIQYNIDGFDREGRLVLMVPLGKWDFGKCISGGRENECNGYLLQMFERIVYCVKTNKNRSKFDESPPAHITIIGDLEGLSWSKILNRTFVKMTLRFCQIFEEHYPELLDNFIVINATTTFNTLLKLIKPVISAKTVEKMTIFGTNRSEWEPYLHKLIDPEEIKMRLGGKYI